MQASSGNDDFENWRDKKALSEALESLYSGIERILLQVTRGFDGDAPVGDDWHRRLIDRLARANPNIRPALISATTREGLDDLRAFRRRSRMGYGAELDRERTLAVAQRAFDTLDRFHRELAAFAKATGLVER